MVVPDRQQITYEELENRIAELARANKLLEQKIKVHERVETALRTSEVLFHVIVDKSWDGMVMLDQRHRITYASPSFTRISGYTPEELIGECGIDYDNPDDLTFIEGKFRQILEAPGISLSGEYRFRHKLGHWLWMAVTMTNMLEDPHVRAVVLNLRDITDLKRTEEELKTKSRKLEEANIALNVLLSHRDEERRALENRIVVNVKELIYPYFEKLRSTSLSDGQAALLDLVDSNLEDIISPFVQKMTMAHSALTPTEIQVANLIKDGKRSKEIARLLNVSMGTLEFHRNNIRKKLGIGGKKLSLHAHLLSLQEGHA